MKTIHLILCALFAALTAVLTQISVPVGAVPFNLATFSVLCAGALLGAKLGAISQIVYVLLGLVGAPVFSGFRGGPQVLSGPTGGYIVGYVLAAFVVGLVVERSKHSVFTLTLALIAGFFAYMIPGTLWFMYSTRSALIAALMTCVVPFLIGDAIKIALATTIAYRLRPMLEKMLHR